MTKVQFVFMPTRVMILFVFKTLYLLQVFCWTDFEGMSLKTISFTYKQLKSATDNFSPSNKIGEGGFGPVYKVIIVKQLFILCDYGFCVC